MSHAQLLSLKDIEWHYDLANTYHSMGLTYKMKKDYSQALNFFQKSVHIRQLCLPENYPDLADVFHNIAHIYIIIENIMN
jgi:tetratricopeptide (TPR) repeat protein